MAKLQREVVGSVSLEMFKGRGNVALRDVVSGSTSGMTLVVFANLNGSMITMSLTEPYLTGDKCAEGSSTLSPHSSGSDTATHTQ